MKHTKLPLYETVGGSIHDAEGLPVVNGVPGRFKDLGCIVLACNNHERLVEALKEAKDALKCHESWHYLIQKIDAALDACEVG